MGFFGGSLTETTSFFFLPAPAEAPNTAAADSESTVKDFTATFAFVELTPAATLLLPLCTLFAVVPLWRLFVPLARFVLESDSLAAESVFRLCCVFPDLSSAAVGLTRRSSLSPNAATSLCVSPLSTSGAALS